MEKIEMEQYEIGEKVIGATGEEVTIASELLIGRNNEPLYLIRQSDGGMLLMEEKFLKRKEAPFDPYKMSFKISIEENLAIARAYYDGKEIEKGHGHIFHDGIDGILQSVSYAFKKMWLHYTGQEEG